MKAANKKFAHSVIWYAAVALALLSANTSFAQDTLDLSNNRQGVNKKRMRSVIIGATSAYTVSMAGLYHLWYQDSQQQSFRFFNDNAEWKQVDKLGHFGSAFYMSYSAQKALKWCNVKNRKADLIASATGFLVLLPIEIFDGYSDAYGASVGDLTANASGALFFFGQQALWNEVRIFPKFSFHTTQYAQLRPQVLGDTYVSQFFKDYNGQTYWFSVDMDKFMPFPRWLNIAAGYGAEEMVYARDHQNLERNYRPYRQYYLSIDFDLTAIKTRSKALKTLIFLANIIKIPAPALAFSNRGTRFHALYF